MISGSQPRGERPTWRHRVEGLRRIGPVAALIIAIMGSLYLGLASPTELAAVGVLGAAIIAALTGQFSLSDMIGARAFPR